MTNPSVVNVDRSWTATKVVSLIVAILTAGYMAPWAVAAIRDVRHWSVFWINLLFGWTIIGWIIALVMALRAQRLVVTT
ncbi:MAG: superinfection immunity protein [bacterium]|nr:superinfection immunity protein [bacterium]